MIYHLFVFSPAKNRYQIQRMGGGGVGVGSRINQKNNFFLFKFDSFLKLDFDLLVKFDFFVKFDLFVKFDFFLQLYDDVQI